MSEAASAPGGICCPKATRGFGRATRGMQPDLDLGTLPMVRPQGAGQAGTGCGSLRGNRSQLAAHDDTYVRAAPPAGSNGCPTGRSAGPLNLPACSLLLLRLLSSVTQGSWRPIFSTDRAGC